MPVTYCVNLLKRKFTQLYFIFQIMFESFKCPAMYISIQGALSLHSYGLTTGVAVDCGADLMQITPLIDGYTIPGSTSCLPLGGHDLTLHLLKLLAGNGILFSAKHCVRNVCQIKEKHCYIAEDYDKEIEMARKSRFRETFTLPDKRTITLGKELFCCPEVLFQPHILGRDLDGIHKICCDDIIKTNQPDEITKDLFSHVVLSGGSSKFPGLPNRLKKELTLLAPSNMNPNVLVVEQRENNTWIGGSILASLPAFQDMWLMRREYEEKGPSCIHKKCI